MDHQMPGMDGAAACAAMRREPSLALTPIIIMSASSFPEVQQRCLEAGCTEFIIKPDKPDELLSVVARVLATQRRKTTWLTVVFSTSGTVAGLQSVGRARDLSGTGLLLLCGKPISVGAVLDLEFVIPKDHQTVRVRGEVTRADQNAQGVYEAGVHFVEISQDDQETILDYVAS